MSSSAIAKLFVELGADTAAFEMDMGKAAHVARQNLESMKDAAVKAGTLMAGALVVGAGAFTVMAKQAIDAADELDNLSMRAGVSVEELSRLSYAAKMSDTDTEALATGMRKLSDNMVAAGAGNATAKAAFDALGVSVKNTDGSLRSNDEVLKDVAQQMSQFEDGAVKSALATDIFGKAGADLIPMLDEGRDGLEALGAEAESLGQVLSKETTSKAAAFNDTLDKLKMSMGGVVSKVTAEMLPTLLGLAEQVFQTAKDTQFLDGVARGLAAAFKVVVSAGLIVKAIITAIGEAIGQMAAVVAAVAHGDFQQAWDIFNDPSGVDDMAATLSKVGDVWKDNAVAAKAAADAQDRALKPPPTYVPGGAKAAKADKPEKGQQFQELGSGWMDREMDSLAVDEGASASAWLAKEKEKSQTGLDQLQQSLASKRELEMQDYAAKQAQLQSGVEHELVTAEQKNNLLEQMEKQHKERIKALDQGELETKRRTAMQAVSFMQNSLNQIGAHHGKAAKAAQAISKAQALAQLAADTPKAAMAAASAVAGIPLVGPALAVVAAGAMYALGAAAAANVMRGSSSGSSSGGSAGTAIGSIAASAVQPVAEQRTTEASAQSQQSTIIRVPEDRMLTGRQLIDLFDEALGDGKQLNNLRFMPA